MRFLYAVLFLLAGCVVAQPTTSVTQTFVYHCDGGYRLTVREAGERLWLFLPSGALQLTASSAERGRVYRDTGIEFWKKGEDAQLDIAGQNRRNCRSDRLAAIWEDARFRSVDFRAAGNEPGWFVELDSEKIIYAGNYGQQVLTFPPVPPQRDERLAETRYLSVAGEHSLNLLLQGGICRDSMSGEMFDTRVTLDLDGQILYGCGRSLH